MEKTVYSGRFIQVKEQTINSYIWEKVYLPPSLVVFPITKDNKLLMIEEYRPHEKTTSRLKFVTGHIENNEDILECANREIQEEIGYKSEKLELLHHHQSSGTLNSDFYVVVAFNLSPSKIPNPDGEETILSIKEFEITKIEQMIYNQEIKWGLSTMALLKLIKDLE